MAPFARRAISAGLIAIAILAAYASTRAKVSGGPEAPTSQAKVPPPASPLPDPAPTFTAEELAGDARCGPFSTAGMTEDRAFLAGRLALRFLPGATLEGDATTGKIEARSGAAVLFVGALETYAVADSAFARRATKEADFGGSHEPRSIFARDDVTIVAGFLRKAEGGGMVPLAHGWLADADGQVVDVAVFASAEILGDVASCRRLAAKVLGTVSPRLRTSLIYGAAGSSSKDVSLARYHYRLGSDWIQTAEEGIEDFSRITFQRRGAFPGGAIHVELGLDEYPGKWTTPGTKEGVRAGRLLGVPVNWKLTRDGSRFGAWTVATERLGNDHPVASIDAGSAEDRDDAIRFAESVQSEHVP